LPSGKLPRALPDNQTAVRHFVCGVVLVAAVNIITEQDDLKVMDSGDRRALLPVGGTHEAKGGHAHQRARRTHAALYADYLPGAVAQPIPIRRHRVVSLRSQFPPFIRRANTGQTRLELSSIV
jgi:hypothetical protein